MTVKQVMRTKIISALFMFVLVTTFTVNYAVAQMKPLDTKYVWQNQEFASFQRIETQTGYIDMYSNQRWCTR